MDNSLKKDLVLKKRSDVVERLKKSKNPYHNYEHTLTVVRRTKRILSKLKDPKSIPEFSKFLLIESAWRHDDLHCGHRYRQLFNTDNMSNEEYSVKIAEEELREILNKEEINEIRKNILATSFGQNCIESIPNGDPSLYREYTPTTVTEKILAFSDVAGFERGVQTFLTDSFNVICEGDEYSFPVSYEEWISGLEFFITDFMDQRLNWLSEFISDQYYEELIILKKEVIKSFHSLGLQKKKLYNHAQAYLSDVRTDDWVKISAIISSNGVDKISIS